MRHADISKHAIDLHGRPTTTGSIEMLVAHPAGAVMIKEPHPHPRVSDRAGLIARNDAFNVQAILYCHTVQQDH
jgi:hypothetical protein